MSSTGRAFYVATSGSDRNPGTLARPWRTIHAALERVRPGQRIFVRPGIYEESLFVERSGTREAPISLAAYARARPVVRPRATGEDTYGIRIDGSYVRVKGFVFEGASGTSSANVYVMNGARNIELRGNVIRNGGDQGIYTEDGTENVQIIANVVHDNGAGLEGQHQSHGMYLNGARHVVVNNLVYDHPHGFGIHVYDENDGTIVVGNTVAYSAWSGILLGGGDVRNIIVRNNISAYNRRYGIARDEDEPESSLVDTNLVFANGWGGIQPDFEGADLSRGNLSAPPRFVSARRRDFRLTRRSAAIDRALPAYSRRADIAGVERPQGRRPDLGAFEWVRK
jgi:hypothetical protein